MPSRLGNKRRLFDHPPKMCRSCAAVPVSDVDEAAIALGLCRDCKADDARYAAALRDTGE